MKPHDGNTEIKEEWISHAAWIKIMEDVKNEMG